MRKKWISLLVSLVVLFSFAIAAAEEWICPNCGKTNTTNFCTSCGTKHDVWTCPECGTENSDAFCGNCGNARPVELSEYIGLWKADSPNEMQYVIFRENGTVLIISETGQASVCTFMKNSSRIAAINAEKIKSYKCRLIGGHVILDDSISCSRMEGPVQIAIVMKKDSEIGQTGTGDTVFFEIRNSSQPERYDIAAVISEQENDIVLNRVIGLPGDTIENRDGFIYINNEKVIDQAIIHEYECFPTDFSGPVTVPEGQYFILGDWACINAQKILGIQTEKKPNFAYVGTLTGFIWVRQITIDKLTDISESGWSLPADAVLVEQKEEIHHYNNVLDHYEDKEVQRSRQVVDHYETYYTYTDNGDGSFTEVAHERPVYTTEYYTETVQSPVYQQKPVYATKYYYTTQEWQNSRTELSSGSDQNPLWPDITLEPNEREAERTEMLMFEIKNRESALYFIADAETWEQLKIGETIHVIQKKSKYYLADETGKMIAQLTRYH